MLFSDQLRQALKKCGETKYRISKESGVDMTTLTRFEDGSGLALDTVDKLVEYLKMDLKPRKGRGVKK